MGKLFDRVRKHIQDKALEREQEWVDEGVLTPEQLVKFKDNLDKRMQDPRYFMNIGGDNLKKVFKSGQFKNQFQSNQSGGLFDKDVRAAHTNKFFGTPLKVSEEDSEMFGGDVPLYKTNTKALKDAEKYGWATTNFYTPWSLDKFSMPNQQYGSYIVEFNPKKVGNRATLHLGDSLNDGDNMMSFIPGDKSTYGMMLPDFTTFGHYARAQVNPARWVSDKVETRTAHPKTLLEAQYHESLEPSAIRTIFKDRKQMNKDLIGDADRLGIRLEDAQGCYRNCDQPDADDLMEIWRIQGKEGWGGKEP